MLKNNKNKLNKINNRPLFINNGRSIFAEDILSRFKELGVNEGDCLMFHSDLSVFGKLPEYFQGRREEFLKLILDVFKQAVGSKGTILMPTYTYSFLKGESYDIDNQPSTAGVITEYFRKQKDVVRTDDPNLSFAVWGKEKFFFKNNLGVNPFRKNSVFDKLYAKGGKIIFFGIAVAKGTTYTHLIENKYGVSHRYKKIFSGTIINKGKQVKKFSEYDVCVQDRHVLIDCEKLAGHFKKKEIFKETTLGGAPIGVVDARKYFNEGIKMLQKNERIFLSADFFTKKNDYSVKNNDVKAVKAINNDLFKRAGRLQNQADKMPQIMEKYFSEGVYKFDASENFSEAYIPGLDKREFVVLCGALPAASGKNLYFGLTSGIWLAKRLLEMQVKLKYSYRFIFLAEPRDFIRQPSYLTALFPRTKYFLSLSRQVLSESCPESFLCDYMNLIYAVEHNGIFMKQKNSYRPKLQKINWLNWLKSQKISQKQKKLWQAIYKSCSGQADLLDVSRITGTSFKDLRKVVDIILRAGFLIEIENII